MILHAFVPLARAGNRAPLWLAVVEGGADAPVLSKDQSFFSVGLFLAVCTPQICFFFWLSFTGILYSQEDIPPCVFISAAFYNNSIDECSGGFHPTLK